MQIYECNHCHLEFPRIFDVFLHIFVQHLHIDVGLVPAESKWLLKSTAAYRMGVPCLN